MNRASIGGMSFAGSMVCPDCRPGVDYVRGYVDGLKDASSGGSGG